MIKKLFILLFSIYSFCGFSQSETSSEKEKLIGLYPLIEYGYNHNNKYINPDLYSIHNLNIGMGISVSNIKIEFAYPFLQSYDSTRLFGNSFSCSIAYAFKTKYSSFRIIPRINFMGYHTIDHLVAFDSGSPNILVPIRYVNEVNIRKYTSSIGFEKNMNKSFTLGIDLGLSFFKVYGKTYSEIDRTEATFRHELNNPESDIDLIKLFFGVRVLYLINLVK